MERFENRFINEKDVGNVLLNEENSEENGSFEEIVQFTLNLGTYPHNATSADDDQDYDQYQDNDQDENQDEDQDQDQEQEPDQDPDVLG